VITHGHEDHIGGLPYLWPELNVPIYSQKLTCGMIKGKFKEHGLPTDQIKTLTIDDEIKVGVFELSFYQVSHSIPDSTGIVIRTPVGIIIHQADFKMDWTPVNGQVTDVAKLARISAEGVILMNIDCLRSEKVGYNLSERSIEGTFDKVEKEAVGKVLITMTSSNLTRVQQAINVAVRSGRKLILSGRSLENNFQIGRDLGYLDVPPGLVVAQDEIKKFTDDKVLVLIAGAFGQPDSSLARAANGTHKFISLTPEDSVVISADPIPSTEEAQGNLIDNLTQKGCNVYYSATQSNLHVSGHAAQEELKVMVSLAKPKYLLPIGGNFRHMKVFSRMMQQMGYQEEQILMAEDGSVIEVTKQSAKITGSVEVHNVYVDGYGVGDVGKVILRDRQVMSEEGVVVIIVTINQQTGQVEGEPDVISRGFVFEETARDLLNEASVVVKNTLSENGQKISDWRFVRRMIENNLEKFLYSQTERRPLILPLVVEV
jgi:ribonuclease J